MCGTGSRHLASDFNFDGSWDQAKHLFIHDNDLHGVPVAELDGKMVPVPGAQKLGHGGVGKMSRDVGCHFADVLLAIVRLMSMWLIVKEIWMMIV